MVCFNDWVWGNYCVRYALHALGLDEAVWGNNKDDCLLQNWDILWLVFNGFILWKGASFFSEYNLIDQV